MSGIQLPFNPFPFGGIASASQSITSISNANGQPVALTVTAHGYPIGTQIYIRVASVTGQTAINGSWVAYVTDANTLTILWPAGFGQTAFLGNGTGSGSGTLFRTPIPITINYPQFANQGIEVHSMEIQVSGANSGTNCYLGLILPPSNALPKGLFMSPVSPWTGVLEVAPKSQLAHIAVPVMSYQGANKIPIDNVFVDFDAAGDVLLVEGFQV